MCSTYRGDLAVEDVGVHDLQYAAGVFGPAMQRSMTRSTRGGQVARKEGGDRYGRGLYMANGLALPTIEHDICKISDS